ncbi:unnamed protein product [Arctogadus glacialis]
MREESLYNAVSSFLQSLVDILCCFHTAASTATVGRPWPRGGPTGARRGPRGRGPPEAPAQATPRTNTLTISPTSSTTTTPTSSTNISPISSTSTFPTSSTTTYPITSTSTFPTSSTATYPITSSPFTPSSSSHITSTSASITTSLSTSMKAPFLQERSDQAQRAKEQQPEHMMASTGTSDGGQLGTFFRSFGS